VQCPAEIIQFFPIRDPEHPEILEVFLTSFPSLGSEEGVRSSTKPQIDFACPAQMFVENKSVAIVKIVLFTMTPKKYAYLINILSVYELVTIPSNSYLTKKLDKPNKTIKLNMLE
jgi:predicted transglutaminase-like protease